MSGAPLLGTVALGGGLAVALVGVVAGLAGGVADHRRAGAGAGLTRSAERAVYGAAALVTVATGVLWWSFATTDYTLDYVANHTRDSDPFVYRITALWSGQQGSLLFWTFLLSLWAAVAVAVNRRRAATLAPWAAATLLAALAFFSAMDLVAAFPFATTHDVIDGAGLNPVLQNYWMAIHPVALYAGFTGLTVPFAYGVAALCAGRFDATWVALTRRFTLIAWGVLGAGILMGARWAYEELTFGGFWAWDPVENASLIPWLVGTAFLHSVVIQEKRGMLKRWNVTLVMATFALVLLGTFLTRSGVVSSVHAFAQSGVGWWFVGAIGTIVAGGALLIAWRWEALAPDRPLVSPVSREGAFLVNNLLLATIAVVILAGTVFPLATKALSGEEYIVGPAWFTSKLIWPTAALLVMMGLAPLMAWRRAPGAAIARAVRAPLVVGAVVGGLTVAAGARPALDGGLVFGLLAFVLATVVLEFSRGAEARRRATGEGRLVATARIVSRNRGRYGGYLVHAGIVGIFVGIAGVALLGSRAENVYFHPGDRMSIGGFDVRYEGSQTVRYPNRTEQQWRFTDGSGGSVLAKKQDYNVAGESSFDVAIRTLPTKDLYIVPRGPDQTGDDSVLATVVVNPLISFLWGGGIVVTLGTLLAFWPESRRRRRPPRPSAAVPERRESELARA